MIRIIEFYYLIGLFCVLGALVIGISRKSARTHGFILAAIFGAIWFACILKLESRSKAILHGDLSSVAKVVDLLGRPETIVDYPEGDAEWVYSVRVWPWNAAVGISIYREHLMATSRSDRAGLFYRREIITRDEKASNRVRKMLSHYDSDH